MKSCGEECKHYDGQAGRCSCIPNAPFPTMEGRACQLESGAAEKLKISKAEVFGLVCRRCEEISKLSPVIKAQPVPVGAENRTAYVSLSLPEPIFFVNQRLKGCLAELYALADMVLMAKNETGIVLSFFVNGTEEP